MYGKKKILTPGKKGLISKLIAEYNIKTGRDLQKVLKDLLGNTKQNILEAELDEHIGFEKYESSNKTKTNYRNGRTSKKLKSSVGPVEIDVPRDRSGEFGPKVVPKYNRRKISLHKNIYIALFSRNSDK